NISKLVQFRQCGLSVGGVVEGAAGCGWLQRRRRKEVVGLLKVFEGCLESRAKPKVKEEERFFDIDLNMQPTRHSSVLNTQTGRMHNLIPDLNEEPSRHSSFVSQTSMWHDSSTDEQIEIERLRKQIPKVVHPYILVLGIQNVGSDGNCGFRAVALGLGLSEDQWPRIMSDLVRELEARRRQYKYVFGTIGYEKIYNTVKFAGKWMEMPDTGLVIALVYKKVVVNLSDAGGCNTSFPLWSRPSQSDSHETIVVAHVDGNHYIRVALREGLWMLCMDCSIVKFFEPWGLVSESVPALNSQVIAMSDPANAVPAITTLLTHTSAKEPLGTSAGGPPGAGEGPAEGPGERAVGASVEGDGDGPDMGDGVGEAGVGAGARTGAGEGVGGASVGETVGAATGETVGAATGAWAMHEVAKRANNMNNLHILAEAI
nr:hypothetical protein [Tanacetum cinerariifolium]